jgi:hypothetical protein
MRRSTVTRALCLPVVLTAATAAHAIAPFTDMDVGLLTTSSPAVAWGDYDSDGELDVLVAGEVGLDRYALIYRNDNGVFVAAGAGLLPMRYVRADWGDYDGDGDLDLLVASNASGAYSGMVYRNDAGSFVDIAANLAGSYRGDAKWGDYDNDGDLDIYCAGNVYRNDGGVFTDVLAGLAPLCASAAEWLDYDNDGDLDIAVAGADGLNGQSYLYRNDGGVFTDTATPLAKLFWGDLAAGDYDSDGDLDLVITGRDDVLGAHTELYQNQDGSLVQVASTLPDMLYAGADWGDQDNDGDVDLLLSGRMGSYLARIYKYDAGAFSPFDGGLFPVANAAAEWGDYDSDGDLDVVIAGRQEPVPFTYVYYCEIYRNNAGVPNTRPAPPTGLSASYLGGEATFSWVAAFDAETPRPALTYNLRVGTTPGGDEIMSGQAFVGGSDDGKRLLPAMGNVQHNTSWTLHIPPGTYYWSVQAIDSAFAGSAWAVEQNNESIAPLFGGCLVGEETGGPGSGWTAALAACGPALLALAALSALWRRKRRALR